MKLYVLRAKTKDEYDCPDNGLRYYNKYKYKNINFSTSRDTLEDMAKNLNKGHDGYSTKKRFEELYNSPPNYENNCIYSVEDVSDILI